MKLGIIALGTQGDVQPYLALGGALARAGHDVRLVVPEGFEDGVAVPGLHLSAVPGNARAVLDSPEMRALLERGRFLEIQRFANRQMRAVAPDWARAALAAVEGTGALLAGLGGQGLAQPISEKLGVPLLEAQVVPLTPTREFAGPLVPGALPAVLNRLSHTAIRTVFRHQGRGADRVIRQTLNVPKVAQRAHKTPTLYGISPSVVPRPADWGPGVHLTGYWLLEPDIGWTPPPELQAFLDAGPPPVCIGFGSMGNRDPRGTADLVLEALARTGQRAVLLSGWGGLLPGDVPEHVHVSGPVPHTWLFPRAAAVVHHGGAGTTAAGLRAGVPNTVVPFFGDQPFWGRRVAALGAGPAPIPRRMLTAEALAGALRAMEHEAMRERATALGERIRAEDGLGTAVRVIGNWAAERRLR